MSANPNAAFQAKLRRVLRDMEKDATRGVRLATAFVKLESQKLVPVDEGNLKASAYTSVYVRNGLAVGEVGFTADYAVYVHEAPMTLKGLPRMGSDAKGKYWDKQGQATNKFLEKAIDGNERDILKIIHKAAKI